MGLSFAYHRRVRRRQQKLWELLPANDVQAPLRIALA